MRHYVAISTIVLVATAILIGGSVPKADASTGPIPLNCDRACLENVMNQYLAALVAHDPKRLPLSKDVMYTENAQRMELGDGFWKTVEGRGNYTHLFADPEFGQVAFMGTMREAGAPLLMSLRLRIELGRITEIESVYFRPGGGGPNNIADMDKYKSEDIWFKSIPPAQRMSRQELICQLPMATLRGCREMMARASTGPAPIPSQVTVIALKMELPPRTFRGRPTKPKDAINLFSMDCLSQFKLGIYFVVQNIHGRRFPLVDRERGVVWAHAVFDQGTVSKGTLSDGRPYEFKGFNRPSSILVTEVFLIENGKIRRVEAVAPSAFYHINSPWPGNLSGD